MELKRRLRQADALLIVTPEDNCSVAGVRKNAVGWASWSPANTPFNGKPAAILGGSASAVATARAQYDLRKLFVFVTPLDKPEVMLGHAPEKFGAGGHLTDETTRKFIRSRPGLPGRGGWRRRSCRATPFPKKR